MRDLLTYIGIGLIVVLTAVLGAPYVVDFDDHRARFAEEISRATGAQARLDGPIEFRVLPTPYFSAMKVSLAGPLGSLRADKAVFELSLPALLQGRMSFTRAELSRPEIDIDADRLQRPYAQVQFDSLVLRDGALRVSHAGKTFLALDHLDVTGLIPAADGPYDLRGAFRLHDQAVAYSLAGDTFAGKRLPLKLRLTAPNDEGRLDLDGALDLSGPPTFAGKASAEGALAPGAWRAEGELAARPESVKLEKAVVRLGEGVLAAKLSGSVQYGPSAGALSVDVAAARLGGSWADLIARVVARASDRAAPTALRLQVDALQWRGDWSRVKLSRDPGAPLRFSAESARGARVEATAALDRQNVWRGRADLSAPDFGAFAAASGAPPLPFRQVAASGDFSVSAESLAISNARISLDRARFSGDLSWLLAAKQTRAKLTAKLVGTDLDPAATPDFLATVGGDHDLDLTLDAQTPKGDGRLALRLLRDKTISRVEKLDAKNFAGADFSALGEWSGAFSGVKGAAQLKANNLSEFAALLARLAPGETTRLLASRAKLVSPASLNAKAENGGYTLEGQAGASKISAALDGKSAVALDIGAPEASDILIQLGAPPLLSLQKFGPGRIVLQTQGEGLRLQGGRLEVTGKAMLGKFAGDFAGVLREGEVTGALSLEGDPSSLIGGPPGPGKIEALVQARDGHALLRQIVGARGDSHFTGQLALSPEGVSGELDVDIFSAPAFLALTLGASAPIKKGAVWPSLSFAPVLIDPPRTKITVHAAEVAPFGIPASFDLTLAPNALSVAKIEARASGGMLRGGFDLRKTATQATLSGEMSGEGIALKNPALSAKIGGRIKFAGSGANMAALVGALAGTGSAKIADLTVAGVAADAPDQVLAAQATSETPFNAAQTARDLDQALARNDLHVADGETPLRLSEGGVQGTRDSVAFSYDLNDLSFALVAGVAGGRGELTWSGPWSAPARKLDAGSFVTLAATKALEREQARIVRQHDQDRQRKAELERSKREDTERRRQVERDQKIRSPQAGAAAPEPPESSPAPSVQPASSAR